MTKHHLHLISDSTGGTLTSVVKACLAQFEGVEAEQHFWPLVRSKAQLEQLIEQIGRKPGMVLYTIVDDTLGRLLEKHCRALGVPAISVLTPVMKKMAEHFHMQSRGEAGLQHRLNDEYFARMDAVDFALYHDDGQKSDSDLAKADVILVGVSRTSKTPTCIYLANRGIKAANVPLVPGIPFPDNVLALQKPMFVALTATPDRLIDIRRTRLTHLGQFNETDYLDNEKVHDEVREARRFYGRMGWPVIDVTRRSIEETAAEIISLLEQHRARLKEQTA